jgi:hypothetical protein
VLDAVRRRRTSGCTGAGAAEVSITFQRRRAGPVNLVVSFLFASAETNNGLHPNADTTAVIQLQSLGATSDARRSMTCQDAV